MSKLQRPRSDLFDAIWGPVKANIHELTSFLPIEQLEIDEGLRDAIIRLVEENTYESLTMATIIVGVISNKQPVFLFSGPLSLKYLKANNVSSHTSFSGSIKARLIKDKAFLIELVPWKRVRQGYRAGLYTLSNPAITSMIDWWPTDEELSRLAINFSRVGDKDVPA